MEVSYYIRVRGRQQGPYDQQTLLAMASRGRFARYHEVSTDGVDWFRAAEFPELFPSRTARTQSPRPSESGVPSASSPASTIESSGTAVPAEPAGGEEEDVFQLEESFPPDVETPAWFYAADGQEVGPVSSSQLRSLLGSGAIPPQTAVWHPDLQVWTPACQVTGLASSDPVPAADNVGNEGLAPDMRDAAAGALRGGTKFCHRCSRVLDDQAEICPGCGVPQPVVGRTTFRSSSTPAGPNRVAAFLFAWFLGLLGAHKFYLGQTAAGVSYLLANILLSWTLVVPLIFGIVCFIEGIMYLTCSDEEFARKYAAHTSPTH